MRDASAKVGEELESVDCPVCETAESVTWMDDGKPTRYVRCLRCGTVYASPRQSRAARFRWLDSAFGVGESALKNATSRLPALATEAAIIHKYVASGTLLDIGCDLGHFFQWFAEPAWQRHGVELSPSAATYAARTYSAQVYAGTIHQAAYPARFFDLVTMIDMLYYVDDPCAELKEVGRILKPDGWLAIELSGQAYQLLRSRGLLTWLLDGRGTRLHTDSAYLYWYSPTSLRCLLSKAGFRVMSWHVVSSPDTSGRFQKALSAAYFRTMSRLVNWSLKALTLAPKYLCLAQPISSEIVS